MKRSILIITAAVAAAAGSVRAQGTFTRLGAPDTYLSGISADGAIAVGVRGGMGPAFRWTAGGGVVTIGGVGQQAKISRDGTTIVSDAQDSMGIVSAAIWQGGTTWKTLGGVPGGRDLDNALTSAWGVSADGSVIVGLAWVNDPPGAAHAMRWDVSAAAKRGTSLAVETEPVVGLRSGCWRTQPMEKK